MKVLFIGGTGIISSACSELAIKKGIKLYHFNRGKSHRKIKGVVNIQGDIRNKKEAVESFLFNAKKAGHILSRKKVEELYNFDRIISVKKLFDHVHVINIDEFNKNPKKHYIKIIEFLELEKPIKYPSFKLYGERRYAKSPIIYKLLKNMTLRKIADFLPIPTRVRKIFFKLDRWSKEGEIIHDKKHKTK